MASNERARALVEEHVERVRPLMLASNRASWEAATTGAQEEVARSAEARAAVKRLYSDREAAERVRDLLRSGGVDDPLLHRQLVLLELAFASNQIPEEFIEELSRREGELEMTFYTHRARLDGREVADNELLEILRTERDGERRRQVWEASKTIGRAVAGPLRELVRRRNEAARSLGYPTFYSMELAHQEIDEAELFAVLDDFRRATDAPFAALREAIDHTFARRYGIDPVEARPWHWEDFFSQEAPSVGEVDLNPLFEGRDLVEIAARYFDAIALPVQDVLERSDLFERPGKDQHAFCTDIDREGDVRVLCNLRGNEKWMSTLMHELGHAVYDKFLPGSLPFALRSAAHTLSTESIAMFMGRLTRDPRWLGWAVGADLGEEEREDVRFQQRASMLVAARWILVMAYFERELYRDPDRADLDSLWWDLVEGIQRVRRPEGREEPDWAAKIHLSLAPVYYHNYLLGEMMASQLDATIARRLPEGASPIANPAVGGYLREEIFARGATLHWNDLLVAATGERLSPRHWVAQFV